MNYSTGNSSERICWGGTFLKKHPFEMRITRKGNRSYRRKSFEKNPLKLKSFGNRILKEESPGQ